MRLPTLIPGLRDLPSTRGNLKSGLGDAAGLSCVDFRIVFLPPLTNSMSSLSSRLSLICPRPNEACSTQSKAFQCTKLCFRDAACNTSITAPILRGCPTNVARGIGAKRKSPLAYTQPRTIRSSLADHFFNVKNTPRKDDRAVHNCSSTRKKNYPRKSRVMRQSCWKAKKNSVLFPRRSGVSSPPKHRHDGYNSLAGGCCVCEVWRCESTEGSKQCDSTAEHGRKYYVPRRLAHDSGNLSVLLCC